MELAFQLWQPTDDRKRESAERILLLHGMGGTGQLWRPIAASLEEDFRILAPDQRGHGKSRIHGTSREPVRYRPLDYGRDLIETLIKARAPSRSRGSSQEPHSRLPPIARGTR